MAQNGMAKISMAAAKIMVALRKRKDGINNGKSVSINRLCLMPPLSISDLFMTWRHGGIVKYNMAHGGGKRKVIMAVLVGIENGEGGAWRRRDGMAWRGVAGGEKKYLSLVLFSSHSAISTKMKNNESSSSSKTSTRKQNLVVCRARSGSGKKNIAIQRGVINGIKRLVYTGGRKKGRHNLCKHIRKGGERKNNTENIGSASKEKNMGMAISGVALL